MTLTVTHTKVATLPDEPGAEVNKAEWNAAHSVAGTIDGTGITAINNTPIGGSTPSTGAFTTLAASSTVSGQGFTDYLASPPAIGGTAAAAGSFTTLAASSTVSGTGFSTYLASPPAIGGTVAAAISGTTITCTTKHLGADGAVGTPSYGFSSETNTGFYKSATNQFGISIAGTKRMHVGTAGTVSDGFIMDIANADAWLMRVAANGIRFSSANATTTSRTELNKAVASIANAVATDVLTVTIPNAAHSASLLIRVTGSLGAGGAIGANEATATNTYIASITRTAGVATVVTLSSAFGAAACAVAGAATVTCTAAATAMTGAVSAQQTFTIQATISRSAGSSTNHTCLVYAQLMNANATGITIA